MDPKIATALIGLVPYVLQILPRIVELVEFARNAPEEMTTEEIVLRWAETVKIVEKGNTDWEAAVAARKAAEAVFTDTTNEPS